MSTVLGLPQTVKTHEQESGQQNLRSLAGRPNCTYWFRQSMNSNPHLAAQYGENRGVLRASSAHVQDLVFDEVLDKAFDDKAQCH